MYCVAMGPTDQTIRPGHEVVTVLDIKSEDNRIVPQTLDPSTIFYNLNITGSRATAPEVSVKIDFDVGIYIPYDSQSVWILPWWFGSGMC